MKSYSTPKGIDKRSFVISPYFISRSGQPEAEIPNSCPTGYHSGGACRISVHHYRARETGPCFPLAVVKCHTHKLCFTVYPPGYVPYGRQPLTADIATNGNDIVYEQDGNCNQNERLPGFESSLFEAALSASRLEYWPKESERGSLEARFITQLRHLDRASYLLGVHHTLKSEQTEHITDILNLPGQPVFESALELKYRPAVKIQGQTICKLLAALPPMFSYYERLVDAGSIANLWPPPFFWNHRTKRLRAGSFRRVGTGSSP